MRLSKGRSSDLTPKFLIKQRLFKMVYAKRILRRLNSIVVGAGPYRFVTRRYFGTNDIAMSSRILHVESFRHDILPQPLPIRELRSILVLAPHQDDEAIGAGGTLILGNNSGAKVSIVYFTDGDQGGESKNIRREESLRACEKLGAEMFELNISNLELKPQRNELEKLNEIISKTRPDVILCPWFLDGAPKHRMINHLLWLANFISPLPEIEIWGYQVQNTLLPNGYVDFTEVVEEKRELLQLFSSQNAERHWDHVNLGLAAWNSRLLSKSAEPRYVEIFHTLPVREFLDHIEAFYFQNLSETYVGEPGLSANLQALHHSINGTMK